MFKGKRRIIGWGRGKGEGGRGRGEEGGGGKGEEWVKTRRGRGQLYMLAIDAAQLVINKNCIKKVLQLKI